jgi:preprotein translocase subunit YajC
MWGYGILTGIVLVLIFWFLIVAPMERRMHERRMELMRRRLERNEERLRKLRKGKQAEAIGDNVNSGDAEDSAKP